MTRYRIRISSRAWFQIQRASAWWRKHRDKAPSAFDDDLFEALALLRTNPGVGRPVRLNRGRARRYWMERIRYFIYYRELANDVIEISSIRHGARR